MTSTENYEQITINFFDGSNMKIDFNIDIPLDIDFIRANIMSDKDIKNPNQLSLFNIGEEDELTKYEDQKVLFCLIKQHKDLIFEDGCFEMKDPDLQKDYEKVADYLKEVVSNKYQDEDIDTDDLLEYIQEQLADEEFNTEDDDDYTKIWKSYEDIIKEKSVNGILEKFHNIKDFIEDQICWEESTDEKIDMNNYKQIYAYALARAWCDDVNIESGEDYNDRKMEIQEAIKDLILKKMYWEVDDNVKNSYMNNCDEDDEEYDEEYDEERFQYSKIDMYNIEIPSYYDMIDEYDDDDVEKYIKSILNNDRVPTFDLTRANYEEYLPDCLDNLKMSKKIILDVIRDNDEFDKELYERFI
tara:strand:- start:12 stop:1082 length:1071 start_codon:yes stop_codon:yes gene_type:complete